MHVSILIANTKSDLLANRRKPSFWVRGPRHRYQTGLEAMVTFQGIHECACASESDSEAVYSVLQCFH